MLSSSNSSYNIHFNILCGHLNNLHFRSCLPCPPVRLMPGKRRQVRSQKKTVDGWYRSIGREGLGQNGKKGGRQGRLSVLNSRSLLRSYIGHGKL